VDPNDPLPDQWRVSVTFSGYPPLTKTVSSNVFNLRFWSDEFGFPTTYWPATPGQRLSFTGEIQAVGGPATYEVNYVYASIEPPSAGQNGCPVYVGD